MTSRWTSLLMETPELWRHYYKILCHPYLILIVIIDWKRLSCRFHPSTEVIWQVELKSEKVVHGWYQNSVFISIYCYRITPTYVLYHIFSNRKERVVETETAGETGQCDTYLTLRGDGYERVMRESPTKRPPPQPRNPYPHHRPPPTPPPPSSLNTLRPRQNGCHFADDTFKPILLNENIRISIKISLKFVLKVPIDNIPSLVQIMAWRRPGDKPLSEPMMVCLLTHICVTRPQWV